MKKTKKKTKLATLFEQLKAHLHDCPNATEETGWVCPAWVAEDESWWSRCVVYFLLDYALWEELERVGLVEAIPEGPGRESLRLVSADQIRARLPGLLGLEDEESQG